MTGLKSGSGDDLWDEDSDEEDREDAVRPAGEDRSADLGETSSSDSRPTHGAPGTSETAQEERPYIVRRAVRDEGVQWERPERLTFFVHADVADGERELKNELEAEFGRDIPKFDLREAVYRAALEDTDGVRRQLERMGFTSEDR